MHGFLHVSEQNMTSLSGWLVSFSPTQVVCFPFSSAHPSCLVGFQQQEDTDRVESPPGLSGPASIAGSATTVIVSTLELPLFKGSKRVFVRDAHLFVIEKYVVVDRCFASQITGRGSIFIEDPAPADFPPGTSVRTTGPDDKWTMDDDGKMYLNGIPTNIHSGQRINRPRETEVFETPPPHPSPTTVGRGG